MGSLNPENTSKQNLDDSGFVQDALVGENGYRGQAELLDLSDDVLLYILKYCTPRDLKALGHTCPRLGALICDRTLWTRVDARSSPIGQERLRWLLDHCLSPVTTELKLAGYANKYSRCLGIQDLELPRDPESGVHRGAGAASPPGDVEHFLLRMWYPHLPRFAVTPRWPDKAEAESKAPKNEPTTSNPNSANSANDSGQKKIPERFSEEFEDVRDKCKGPQFTLTGHLMRDLRNQCLHLTSLSLENCNIDYKTTRIRQFPANLKKLSLRGTRCYNLPLNTSYLGKIQGRLPGLEILDVSECDWFEPASLMPLSKLPFLKELYMRECKRLTECVAYASLATRYGFRELRVIDVRGSPLADSEVSALGWLPALEELYCAPPEDFHSSSEHTHSWNDTLATFSELDHWEKEEPDYYKIRSPEPDPREEELPKEEADSSDPAGRGDVLLGNPWWAHDRRIIVIQPNANRQPEALVRPVGPLGPLLAEQVRAPAAEPMRPPVAEQEGPATAEPIRPSAGPTTTAPPKEPPLSQTEPPSVPSDPPTVTTGPPAAPTGPTAPPKEPPAVSSGPSTVPTVPPAAPSGSGMQPGPSKRPNNDESQGLPKRLRLPRCVGPTFSEIAEVIFKECGYSDRGAFEALGMHQHSISIPIRASAWRPPPTAPPRPTEEPAGPSAQSNSPAAAEDPPSPPPRPPADNSEPTPGPSAGQPGPSKRRNSGENQDSPKRLRQSRSCPGFAGFAEAVLGEYNFDEPAHLEQLVGMQRPIAIPVIVSNDALNCPRLRNRRQPIPVPVNAGASTSRNDPPNRPPAAPLRGNAEMHPMVHIDVDIHRPSTIHVGNHIGYHLVSDSAILRFGRADNENVNYVHIGRNGIPDAIGTRPDRSNLRILSAAGYRNITDRSLEHLATAAPNLSHIDFSYTNVTPRGVEVFKAIRPNCEVIFSEFGKMKDDE